MSLELKNVEKVLAYLIRDSRVLVFEHRDLPEAGIQVPGGTVGEGEDLESAAIREVHEESGLILPRGGIHFGRFEWIRKDRKELHFRNVFQFHAPAHSEKEWLHTVGSDGEDNSLVFHFYWMDLAVARTALAVNMGTYLPR